MKSFSQYLTESKKTYAFKIKVAGDLTEDFNQKLKGALEKFKVTSISNGKRTPIQNVPLDFPTLKNTNVTIFDLEISYPTTSEVLENYISQAVEHPLHCVKVVTDNAPSEEYQKTLQSAENKKEALLNTEDMGGESAQEQVGEKKISSFLKDLSQDAKTRAVKEQPKEKATEMPEGSKISPIGSHQNKLPSSVKGK